METDKKLAEKLQHEFDEHCENSRDSAMTVQAQFIEFLHSKCLKLMAEQEWVKVDERVPENDDCILIWNGINVIFGRYEHFHGGSCFTYAGGGQILRPEYWMPLPKGPGRPITLPEQEEK